MEEKDKADSGWIKIYRSIQDNIFWQDKPFSKGQAWVDLLLLACYKDESFMDRKGTLISAKRGTIYRSIRSLAERWGWSRSKADRFLNQLCAEGEIKLCKKRASERTTIFIVNYDKYQNGRASKRAKEKPVKSQSRASEEPVANIYKKDKESIKKVKEEKEDVVSLPSDNEETTDDDTEWVDFSTMSDDEFEKWVKDNGDV